ncbi:MAG: HAMP domain-containing protein [Cyanothece sp. SIO2G6]|nr:HAMP domain-containing protein [Cyanothece sp. SIO2G6]
MNALFNLSKIHSSIARKIGYGYGVAISLGFTGTIAGLLVADYFQGQGVFQLLDAQIQSQILDRFKVSSLRFSTVHLHLAAVVSDPDKFGDERQSFYEVLQRTEAATLELEQFVESDPVWLARDVASMQRLIQNYRTQRQAHRAQVETILIQVDQVWLAPATLAEKRNVLNQIQQELLALNQSAPYLVLEQIDQELQNLVEQAQAQELLAEKDMENAQGLEKLLIVVSALGSVAIAGVIAFRTTQSIVRPIKQVRITADNIIRNQNFDLTIALENDDDLAELAQSFNQLIQWVKEYTQELKQTLNDLKQAQAQLIQTEKMSSLGQLVAGVSHEINNPIGFISGNLSYLNDYFNKFIYIQQLYQKNFPNPPAEIVDAIAAIELEFLQEDCSRMIRSMESGAERIHSIILSLRNFARLDESGMKPADIHEGLNSALMLLEPSLKAHPDRSAITINTHYENLPKVDCYPGHLNQVFMSLLTNAIDAITEVQSNLRPTQSSQNLAIATRADDNKPQYQGHINITTKMPDSKWVEVEIADNGCGISLDKQSRIFDPFFTTKPVGRGSGLGLSISYQIVTDLHNGQLNFDSTPGHGSRFVVRLPLGMAYCSR